MAILHHPTIQRHRSMLVQDVEESAEQLAQLHSVQCNVWTIVPECCFVKGIASPFMIRVAFANVAGKRVELIAPHQGGKLYAEYLGSKGEGQPHHCYTYSNFAALGDANAELIRQGYRLIQHAYTAGVFEFFFLETPDRNGIVELFYINGLSAPDKVFGN